MVAVVVEQIIAHDCTSDGDRLGAVIVAYAGYAQDVGAIRDRLVHE